MPTDRKQIAEAYFDGFRRTDHEAILALLTDDVVWRIHGHAEVEGKTGFDGEIESDIFEGPPKLTIERFIEEGDHIVVPHRGEAKLAGGGDFRFAGVTILGFRGDLIASVDSYVVKL